MLPPRFHKPPHVVVDDDSLVTVRDSNSTFVRFIEDFAVKNFSAVDGDSARFNKKILCMMEPVVEGVQVYETRIEGNVAHVGVADVIE